MKDCPVSPGFILFVCSAIGGGGGGGGGEGGRGGTEVKNILWEL